jgi:hypothetical protein
MVDLDDNRACGVRTKVGCGLNRKIGPGGMKDIRYLLMLAEVNGSGRSYRPGLGHPFILKEKNTMSANDQLIIMKSKGKFKIYHNHCVDNDFKPCKACLLEEKDTLVKAIKFANKYANEWPYVEYGVHICDNCLK